MLLFPLTSHFLSVQHPNTSGRNPGFATRWSSLLLKSRSLPFVVLQLLLSFPFCFGTPCRFDLLPSTVALYQPLLQLFSSGCPKVTRCYFHGEVKVTAEISATGKLRLWQKSLCLCSSVDRTDHPGRTHSCAGWGWSINVPETEVTVKRPISTVMTRAVTATARSNGIYPRVLKQVKSTIAELLPALCDPCFISLWHLGRGRQ